MPEHNNSARPVRGQMPKNEGVRNKFKGAVKKEEDLSSMSVDDALSLLKKKFGK